jgi:hypothetical protein
MAEIVWHDKRYIFDVCVSPLYVVSESYVCPSDFLSFGDGKRRKFFTKPPPRIMIYSN